MKKNIAIIVLSIFVVFLVILSHIKASEAVHMANEAVIAMEIAEKQATLAEENAEMARQQQFITQEAITEAREQLEECRASCQ